MNCSYKNIRFFPNVLFLLLPLLSFAQGSTTSVEDQCHYCFDYQVSGYSDDKTCYISNIYKVLKTAYKGSNTYCSNEYRLVKDQREELLAEAKEQSWELKRSMVEDNCDEQAVKETQEAERQEAIRKKQEEEERMAKIDQIQKEYGALLASAPEVIPDGWHFATIIRKDGRFNEKQKLLIEDNRVVKRIYHEDDHYDQTQDLTSTIITKGKARILETDIRYFEDGDIYFLEYLKNPQNDIPIVKDDPIGKWWEGLGTFNEWLSPLRGEEDKVRVFQRNIIMTFQSRYPTYEEVLALKNVDKITLTKANDNEWPVPLNELSNFEGLKTLVILDKELRNGYYYKLVNWKDIEAIGKLENLEYLNLTGTYLIRTEVNRALEGRLLLGKQKRLEIINSIYQRILNKYRAQFPKLKKIYWD